jgi:hypothetical protein
MPRVKNTRLAFLAELTCAVSFTVGYNRGQVWRGWPGRDTVSSGPRWDDRGTVPHKRATPTWRWTIDCSGVRDRDDTTKRIHAITGEWTETELHLLPHGFSWVLHPAPSVVIRYTATIDGDTWEEVGEIAQNGAPWSTMLSMALRRQE